jgi:hypothetical protein
LLFQDPFALGIRPGSNPNNDIDVNDKLIHQGGKEGINVQNLFDKLVHLDRMDYLYTHLEDLGDFDVNWIIAIGLDAMDHSYTPYCGELSMTKWNTPGVFTGQDLFYLNGELKNATAIQLGFAYCNTRHWKKQDINTELKV